MNLLYRTCSLPFRALLPALLVANVCVLHAQQTQPATAKPQYAAERAQRAREIFRPYGWASLVALHAIHPGIVTVGSARDSSLVLDHAPAHLLQLEDKDGRMLVRCADPSLTLHGGRIAGNAELAVGERDDDALSSGSLRLWLIKRGDQYFLRVKDSQAPALQHMHDLRWYPPSDHYRVSARWVPDAEPHRLQTINKLGQLSESSSPGHVEFQLNGKKLTLVPLEASSESLWFVFRDETYRTNTDQGGRFLTVKAPATGLQKPGNVELDFNEAVNPPCAYSPYATCPLAAKENRLPVAVAAGEKRYDP